MSTTHLAGAVFAAVVVVRPERRVQPLHGVAQQHDEADVGAHRQPHQVRRVQRRPIAADGVPRRGGVLVATRRDARHVLLARLLACVAESAPSSASRVQRGRVRQCIMAFDHGLLVRPLPVQVKAKVAVLVSPTIRCGASTTARAAPSYSGQYEFHALSSSHQCGAELPDGSTSGCWRAHVRVSGRLRALPAGMQTRLEHARGQVAYAALEVAQNVIVRQAAQRAGRGVGGVPARVLVVRQELVRQRAEEL